MRRNSRIARLGAILLFLGASDIAFANSDNRITLDIQVIHASHIGKQVDAPIQKLVQTFTNLDFTSYPLKDEMKIEVQLGASTRVQLPNKMWMQVQAKSSPQAGMIQLGISSDKPKFKTKVNIRPGATIAVGGPPFDKGSLIFAITRRKSQ
jgi:hypothetical protein